MVKRYKPELERDGGLGLPSITMRSSFIGEWVKHEDYRRLQFAVAALLRDIRSRYSMGVDEDFKCQYLRDLESLIK